MDGISVGFGGQILVCESENENVPKLGTNECKFSY